MSAQSFEKFILEKIQKDTFRKFLIFTYSVDKYGLNFIRDNLYFKGKGIIFVGDNGDFRKIRKLKKENIYVIQVELRNNYQCHCKLYLFEISPQKYILIIGSANLNQNSFTENREFVACFDSEQNPKIFAQVAEFLEELEEFLFLNNPEKKKFYKDFYSGLKKCGSNQNKKSDCKFIHSLNRPIIEQLNSSKITKVVSPSFDHYTNIYERYQGRFKIQAIYTAGKVVETYSMDLLSEINKIKKKREIRHLHGKFYEFDDGRKMFGSPNFTTAGLCGCWKDQTGNLETAIIYKNGPSIEELIKEADDVDNFESICPSTVDKDSEGKLLLIDAYHNEIVFKENEKKKISIHIEFAEVYQGNFELKLKYNNIREVSLVRKDSSVNNSEFEAETDREIVYNEYKELIESVDAQVILKYDNKEEECGLTISRIVNQCFSGEKVPENVDPLDILIKERVSIKDNNIDKEKNKKEPGRRNNSEANCETNISQYHDYSARILQSKMKIIKKSISNGEKSLVDTICKGIKGWDSYKNAEKLFILSVLKDIVNRKNWGDSKKELDNIYNEFKNKVELKDPERQNNGKESNIKLKTLKKLELTKEQKDLVNRVMKDFYGKHKGGVLIADRVGSGKSFEALEIIRRIVSKKGLKRCAIFAPRYLISEWKADECNKFSNNKQVFCNDYEKCKEEKNDAKFIISYLNNCINKNDIRNLSRNELLTKLKINKNLIDKLGHIYKYVFIKWNDLRKDKKVLDFFLNAQECWEKSEIQRNGINLISISQMKKFKKARLDIAVVDEIQYLKGGTPARYGAFEKIIKCSPGKLFRIFLSGTPFETNVHYEAYRILRLLLPKKELEKIRVNPNDLKDKNELKGVCETLYNIYDCLKKLHELIYTTKKAREPEEIAKKLMKIYILADLKHSFDVKQEDDKKIRKELEKSKHEKGLDELLRYFMVKQRPEKLPYKTSGVFANEDSWVKCIFDENSLFNTLNLRAELYCREKKEKNIDKVKAAPVEDLIRFTSALYPFSKEKKKIEKQIIKDFDLNLSSCKNKEKIFDIKYHPKFWACIEEIKEQCSDKSQGILGERVVVFCHHIATAKYLRDRLREFFDKGDLNKNPGQNTKRSLGKIWWNRLTKKNKNVKRKRKEIIKILGKYANFMELSEEDLQKKDATNLDPKSVYHFKFAECFNYPRRNKKHVNHIRDIKSYFNDPEKLFPRVLIFVKKGTNGINIQRDCRKLIHFNLDFNPGVLEQREGRINRPNHKPGMIVIKSIVLENSYNGEILARAVFRMKLIDLIGAFAPFWCEENIGVLVEQIFSEGEGDIRKYLREVGKEIDNLQKNWGVIDKEHIGKDKWKKRVTFRYLTKYTIDL